MRHDDTDTETATETRIDPSATDAPPAHIISFGQVGSGITYLEDDDERRAEGDSK